MLMENIRSNNFDIFIGLIMTTCSCDLFYFNYWCYKIKFGFKTFVSQCYFYNKVKF